MLFSIIRPHEKVHSMLSWMLSIVQHTTHHSTTSWEKMERSQRLGMIAIFYGMREWVSGKGKRIWINIQYESKSSVLSKMDDSQMHRWKQLKNLYFISVRYMDSKKIVWSAIRILHRVENQIFQIYFGIKNSKHIQTGSTQYFSFNLLCQNSLKLSKMSK